MIIADTSGLLAFFNRDEPTHRAVTEALEAHTDPIAISPFVVAELDYLVASRLGVDDELAVLRELGSGAYEHTVFSAEDLNECAAIVERYRDQAIGVTDASLVLLADRFDTHTVLTLDRRHFDVLRPLRDGRFTLIPS